VAVVRRALEEPLRRIAGNGGFEGSIVAGKVKESPENAFGFNAATGAYEDLVKAGIIDPTKVSRVALANAASVAALMLTTEVTIVSRKTGQDDAGGPGMHGGMGGMGM
jgi:chaperonin GroEL